MCSTVFSGILCPAFENEINGVISLLEDFGGEGVFHVGLEVRHGVKLVIIKHIGGYHKDMIKSGDKDAVSYWPLVRAEERPGATTHIGIDLAQLFSELVSAVLVSGCVVYLHPVREQCENVTWGSEKELVKATCTCAYALANSGTKV